LAFNSVVRRESIVLISGLGVPDRTAMPMAERARSTSAIWEDLAFIDEFAESRTYHDHDIDWFIASKSLGYRIGRVPHRRAPTGDQVVAGSLLELRGECSVGGSETS